MAELEQILALTRDIYDTEKRLDRILGLDGDIPAYNRYHDRILAIADKYGVKYTPED